MLEVGFEPTKRDAKSDLKSSPLTKYGNPSLIGDTFPPFTPCGTRTHNPQIRSLMRYPIAPMRHISHTGN